MRCCSALWFAVVLTLAGFALRLHNLGVSSFRGDEAFTVINWVRPPLAQTLASDIVVKDPQPPLAYGLIHVWGHAFGEGEFAMRLLPALVSTLGIPALYTLGHRIGGHRTGLLAALLWAVHPLQIWHAQDARNYALWAAFSALALWLALRALDRQQRVDWVLYVVTATAAAYVYYLELFILLALNIFVVIDRLVLQRDWRTFWRWLAAQVVVAALLAPWFVQERLLINSGYGGTRGGNVDPLWLLTDFLPSLTFGTTLPDSFRALLWPVLLIILTAGLLVIRQNRYHLLLILLGTLPLLLLALVSLRLDVYVPRYVLATAPAYVLIVAMLVVTAWNRRNGGRVLAVALAGCWLLVDAYSLYNYYNVDDYKKAADWRTLSQYLSEHVAPDDQVIQAAADEALTFYYADVDRLPANPQQPLDEITATLESRRADSKSIWLVGRTFPDWPNRDVVPAWLAENMQLVRHTIVGGLPVWQYMPWEVRADEITPLAAFANVAQLVGLSIQPEITTSRTIFVWAVWRPLQPSDQPLKIFVHLVGATNPATGTPLWAQDDQFPQDGRISTAGDEWAMGAFYRDVYALDVAGLPPGDYTFLIGLYDPTTGARVPVGEADSLAAGEITVPER